MPVTAAPTPRALAANLFDPAERPDLVRLLKPLAALEPDDDVERLAAALLAHRRRRRLAAEGITISPKLACPCRLRDPSGKLHRGDPDSNYGCYDLGDGRPLGVRGMQDHPRSWRRGRELVALTFEPYGTVGAETFAVAAQSLARDGLALSVCPCCTTHFPGWTTLVRITRSEDRDRYCIG